MEEFLEKNKIVIAIVAGCVILGGFFYAIQISKQNSIEKQQQIELQAKKEQDDAIAPSTQDIVYKSGSYYAGFMQIGGMGSRFAQVSASLVGEASFYLNPAENYVQYYINKPGDHVWVNCVQDKYYATNSKTDNKVTVDPILGIGMELKDQSQNKVSFVCALK